MTIAALRKKPRLGRKFRSGHDSGDTLQLSNDHLSAENAELGIVSLDFATQIIQNVDRIPISNACTDKSSYPTSAW